MDNTNFNCCKARYYNKGLGFDLIILHSEDCPKRWELDLEGNLICTHRYTQFCPSLTMSPCSVCIECGQHSHGHTMPPKIMGKASCEQDYHEVTLMTKNNYCVKCKLKIGKQDQ